MNRDLFLSILAMDSYNRGYGQGISGLPANGVGGASIITFPDTANIQAGWQAAGFYAIAYDWAGETIISYRGTDFGNLDSAARDILAGWSMFTGFGVNAQASLAQEFYKNVTGLDFPTTSIFLTPGDSVTLTGHSLGGGLAANDNSNVEIAA